MLGLTLMARMKCSNPAHHKPLGAALLYIGLHKEKLQRVPIAHL